MLQILSITELDLITANPTDGSRWIASDPFYDTRADKELCALANTLGQFPLNAIPERAKIIRDACL